MADFQIEGFDLCDINNTDEIGLFFSVQHSRTVTLLGYFCHGGTKSKQQVTVLLACREDCSDKLPM
jgi:hypothetical protein